MDKLVRLPTAAGSALLVYGRQPVDRARATVADLAACTLLACTTHGLRADDHAASRNRCHWQLWFLQFADDRSVPVVARRSDTRPTHSVARRAQRAESRTRYRWAERLACGRQCGCHVNRGLERDDALSRNGSNTSRAWT